MWTSSAASTACSKHARSTTLPATRLGTLVTSRSRRFAAVVLLGCLWLLSTTTALALSGSPACTSDSAEAVQLERVIDGDTVVLVGGERVRLIGIDTPELGRRGQPHEFGAIAARDALESLLAAAGEISARTGIEPRDHYDRQLAHLYADGRNVQAILLKDGLATPFIVPPNIRHLDCYELATAAARESGHGLWSHPRNRPRPVSELDGSERGYHVITGRVLRIGHSRSAVWLNFENDFAVRVTRDDLQHFEGIDFDELVGDTLEVRAFIYERNNQLRTRIRHPADLGLHAIAAER